MKKITQSTFIGQQGINLIERRVQSMGFWWYPSQVPEVGIDGHIEIRDPATGEMTNLIIQVQSRATERPFANETDSKFDYICEENDLLYWLQGNAPVILVISRPPKDEAFWIAVKQYFAANPDRRRDRRITFEKQSARFDASARDCLLRLAAPQNLGIYLSPPPKNETLPSNLIELESFAPHIYIAETEYRDPTDLWFALKQSGTQVGCEWLLSDGNLISFHDISQEPWNEFCDVGTFGQYDSAEWALSNLRERKALFIRLLNLALKEYLGEWAVRHDKGRNCYFVKATQHLQPRRINFPGARSDAHRTVFRKYGTGKFTYCRHAAFKGYFKRIDQTWFLEITPTYVFTLDGYRPYRFEGELLQGIKILERNPAVFAQVLLWSHLLARRADLVHADYPFLRFGKLLSFQLNYGLSDREWLVHEDLDVGEQGLKELAELPLLQ